MRLFAVEQQPPRAGSAFSSCIVIKKGVMIDDYRGNHQSHFTDHSNDLAVALYSPIP